MYIAQSVERFHYTTIIHLVEANYHIPSSNISYTGGGEQCLNEGKPQ